MRAFAPGVEAAVRPPLPEEITPGRDNGPALARLINDLGAAHPDAGRLFPAVRAWSMISWQPVVLAVLSVHVAHAVPALDRTAVSGTAAGYSYSFPSDAAQTDGGTALLPIAAARLRAWIDAVSADFVRVARVNARLGVRVVADRLLSTLAVLAVEHVLPPQDAEAASAAWLGALGPSQPGPGLTMRCTGRHLMPCYERRACCLGFRIGAALCPNCPKLSPAERAARTRAHWEAHVRAR